MSNKNSELGNERDFYNVIFNGYVSHQFCSNLVLY